MKPSLEHMGRFDPLRARKRFVNEYQPEHSTLTLSSGKLVGCYAIIPKYNVLYLAHFYVLPEFQGQGIGRLMLEEVLAKADAQQIDLSLTVLNESPAQRFYHRYGFETISADEIDTHMLRKFAR